MHVLNISYVFSCMLQMFHLYVLKVDRVLHMLRCALVAGGQRPTAAVWCCCRGAAMVHVRGRYRGSRADAGARFQTLACDAGGHGARDAMRAGIECKHRALSGRMLPSERDLAWGEGSCVRRTRVWELHPDGCRVPNVGTSRPEIRMILKNKNEIQTLRF